MHQFIIILVHTVYDVTIDVNIEFPQHCDTSDMQFTQLKEPFDEDNIQDVFNRMRFFRIKSVSSTISQSSAQTCNFGEGVYRLNNAGTRNRKFADRRSSPLRKGVV